MVEGMTRVKKDKIENMEIRGLKLHIGCETISHQQFLDDTMLMGHSLVQEAWVLKKFLNTFSRASGLEVITQSLKSYFLTPLGSIDIMFCISWDSKEAPFRPNILVLRLLNR